MGFSSNFSVESRNTVMTIPENVGIAKRHSRYFSDKNSACRVSDES